MSLLHKSSLTGENFFDSNGNPIPGTPFYYHLQQKIDESYQQGYQAGVKFVLDDFENRLKLALYARIDDFKALPPLPDYCKFLNIAMKYVAKAFAVMKSYCNIAPSRINIEATFCKFWLGIEQDLELKRGSIIDTFLYRRIPYGKDNEEEQPKEEEPKPLRIHHMAKPKPIPKSAFGIPEYNDPDPMDNLKNEAAPEDEIEEEEDLEAIEAEIKKQLAETAKKQAEAEKAKAKAKTTSAKKKSTSSANTRKAATARKSTKTGTNKKSEQN